MQSEGDGRRHIRWMAGLSLAAHVLLFAWVSRTPHSAVLETSPSVVDVLELDAEVDWAPARDLATDPTEPSTAPSLAPSALGATNSAPDTSAPPSSNALGGPGLDGDAPLDAVAGAESSDPSDPAAAPGAGEGGTGRRRLSLDQLGVGQSDFRPGAPVDRRRGSMDQRLRVDPTARLQRDLSTAIVHDDVAKGLGPEGPVITAVVAAAHRDVIPFNTRGRLAITADTEGRVTAIDVLSSDGSPNAWNQLAKEVFSALSGKKLRPMGGRGYRFVLAVDSRNQLPSGADPGVDISAFGLPLKKGSGARSHGVRLLDPTTGSLLGGSMDLSDIGQVARRVVHAHLESLQLAGEARPTGGVTP